MQIRNNRDFSDSTKKIARRWFGHVWIALLFGMFMLASYAMHNVAWASEHATISAQGATIPPVMIEKTASRGSVKETGENVTFTVNVTNPNSYKLRIIELKDSVYGDLDGVGSCIIPKIMDPNTVYSCNFTKFVEGDDSGPDHENAATAKVEVYPSHALATPESITSSPPTVVRISDAPVDLELAVVAEPATVPEPGGNVDYTITITNDVNEEIVLSELTDSILGNLNGVGSCVVPKTIGPLGSVTDTYECTFTDAVSGNAGAQISRTLIAKGVDNENGSETEETDPIVVTIIGVSSSLSVSKSAAPASVPESGGDVNYKVTIVNTSSADKVTIQTVVDSKFGNIANTCSPAVPSQLNPGQSMTCSFLRNIAGNSGGTHVSTTSVTAQDDDGQNLTGQASTSVSFSNVASSIQVTKSADRASASRTGDVVTFNVSVKNNSSIDRITLKTINDSIYGNVAHSANPLLTETTCTMPQTLSPTATYACEFKALVTGESGDEHHNQITVTGEDDDQALVQASDDATVLIADPAMSAVKSVVLKTDADNDGAASPGDTLHYQVTISNQGNKTAKAVLVNDNISEYSTLVNSSVTASQGSFQKGTTAGDKNIVANLGDIEQTQSATIDFDVKILNPLPQGVNAISNQASVTGQNFPAVASQNPDGGGPTITRLTLVPELVAEKTAELLEDVDGNTIVSPGDLIEYTIVVRNLGSAPATNVVLTDAPDPNTTVEQGNQVNGVAIEELLNNEGAIVLNLGTIARNSQVTSKIRVRVNSALDAGVIEIVNQAIITSNELPAVYTDDPATDAQGDATILSLSAAPVLSATEVDTLLLDNDNNGSPSAGDVVLLKVQIINSGNGHASSVRFRNLVPENTKLVANTINASQGTILSGTSADDTEIVVNIGTLEGNRTSATISFQLEIASPLPANVTEVYSQGRISADGLDDVVTDDPDISGPGDPTLIQVVARPLLQVAKTDLHFIDADADNAVSVGDTLLYRINVVNVGNREATGVIVEDTPDPHTSLIASSIQTAQGTVTTGNSADDKNVLVAVGVLPGKGGSAVISFMVTVDSTTGIDQIVNQALVKVDDPITPNVQFALSSDDPDTEVKADSTITPVRSASPVIFLPIVTR